MINIKQALKIIIHQLRICKRKTQKISAFGAHLGRKHITQLSVMFTKPKSSNLSYESIIKYSLDKDTVPPEAFLPDDKWVNGYWSDIEVEKRMTRAKSDASESEKNSDEVESRFFTFQSLSLSVQIGPKKQHWKKEVQEESGEPLQNSRPGARI